VDLAAQHPHLSSESRVGSVRIFGLDVLRAAAIAGVVIPHALPVLYPHWSKLGLLGHGGFFGVELFFVLSGFLIGQILIQLGPTLRDRSVLGEFYVRRWFRTLPLYWLFFGINLAIEIHWKHREFNVSDIAGQFFFLRNFSAAHLVFFGESWSLAVEEWFYLLFPFALWMGLKFCRSFGRVILFVAAGFYVFSTVGRFVAAMEPGAVWDGATRIVVINRFDALMTGVLAAWVMNAFPHLWKRLASVLAIAGVILAIGMYATLWRPEGDFVASAHESLFGKTIRFNLISLAFALMLPAASRWEKCPASLFAAGVQNVARWSFSLYLVHGPVIFFVQTYAFRELRTSAVGACLSFVVQLVISLLVSAILFTTFERPIMRLRRHAGPAVARWLTRPAVA
jgi:peptidoglycan/LPS O-acetylase OafA/YrhL